MTISHSTLFLPFLLLTATLHGRPAQARQNQPIQCPSTDTSLLCLAKATERPLRPAFVPDMDPSLPELSYEDRLALISELIETNQLDEQLERETNFSSLNKAQNSVPLRLPASISFKSKK